jgi:hypothetical protein
MESNAFGLRVLRFLFQEEPQEMCDLLQPLQYKNLEVAQKGAHFFKAAWTAAVAAEVVLATNETPVGCSKVAAMTATTLKVVVRGVPIVAPVVSSAVTTAFAVPEA